MEGEDSAITFEYYALNVLIVMALAVPISRFLLGGWHDKRQDLLSCFSDTAIDIYYKTFFPGKTKPGQDTTREQFIRDYNSRFGLIHFAFPIFVLLCTVLFLSSISSTFVFRHSGILSTEYVKQTWVMILAAAGAYTWVLNDIISRVRQPIS
jgi:hypothetical protein